MVVGSTSKLIKYANYHPQGISTFKYNLVPCDFADFFNANVTSQFIVSASGCLALDDQLPLLASLFHGGENRIE